MQCQTVNPMFRQVKANVGIPIDTTHLNSTELSSTLLPSRIELSWVHQRLVDMWWVYDDVRQSTTSRSISQFETIGRCCIATACSYWMAVCTQSLCGSRANTLYCDSAAIIRSVYTTVFRAKVGISLFEEFTIRFRRCWQIFFVSSLILTQNLQVSPPLEVFVAIAAAERNFGQLP